MAVMIWPYERLGKPNNVITPCGFHESRQICNMMRDDSSDTPASNDEDRNNAGRFQPDG